MTVTTLSSRELNQDVGRAKRAAKHGPVLITARGKPTHVLLSIEEYQRITGKHQSLVDALAMPGLSDIDFEPPRSHALPRPADFS
jgi:prevent-host-death family protein